MTAVVLDRYARPRIGVVVDGAEDALVAAVAARTVVLSLLQRLPAARVEVLAAGAGAGATQASALDCGRPVRPLDSAAGQCDDALVVVGNATVAAPAEGTACPVVRLPGSSLDVAQVAIAALGDGLLANRVSFLRLLGWLPPAGTPRVLTGLPEGGPDEIVAAVAASGYAGEHPLLAAIAAGAGAATTALTDALDEAAASALDCWRDRGSPGARPDPTPSRRIAAESASLRVEIRRLEREAEAAALHANHVETQLRNVLGSKSWRYTEGARDMYRHIRRRPPVS